MCCTVMLPYTLGRGITVQHTFLRKYDSIYNIYNEAIFFFRLSQVEMIYYLAFFLNIIIPRASFY